MAYENKINFSGSSIYLFINNNRSTLMENIVAEGQNSNEVLVSFGISGDSSVLNSKFKFDVLDEYGKKLDVDFTLDEDPGKYNVQIRHSAKFLFNGIYDIKVTFFEEIEDENAPANEISLTVRKLQIQGCHTSLVYFTPLVDIQYGYGNTQTPNQHVQLDANKSSIIYRTNENKQNLNTVIVTLTEETPVDIAVSAVLVTRNGLNISYDMDGDTNQLIMTGDYNITITLRRRGTELNGDIMVKNIVGRFSIKESEDSELVGLNDLYVFSATNNVGIIDRSIFKDTDNVVVDWVLEEGVEVVDYSMHFYKNAKVGYINENNDDLQTYYKENYPPILLGNFNRGETILDRPGVYKLTLTVNKYNGPKKTLTRIFVVNRTHTLANLNQQVILDNIHVYYIMGESAYQLGGQINPSFLTTDKVIPFVCFDIIPEEYQVELDITVKYTNSKDTERIQFVNGETVLANGGNYEIYSVAVYDPEDPDFKVVKYNLATFTIIPPPINLDNINISLNLVTTNPTNNKEVLEPVINGTILTEREYDLNGSPKPITRYTMSYPEIEELDIKIYKNDTLINETNMLSKRRFFIEGEGSYTIKFKVKDTTENPLAKPDDKLEYRLLYPNNIVEKVYNLKIVDIKPFPENSTEVQVYINGLLFDPHNYSDDAPTWWDKKDGDPIIIGPGNVPASETAFRIVKPGSYSILIVNKNKFNFNYSINEYNLIVVDTKSFIKPIISPDRVETDKAYKMIIKYPKTAKEGTCMYWDKIEHNDEVWVEYPEDGIYIEGRDCEIYAKYTDSATNLEVEPDKEGVHGPIITNIVTSPEIVGVSWKVNNSGNPIVGVNGRNRYSAAAVYVKRMLQHDYMAWIDGVKINKDDDRYEEGRGIPIEFGVLKDPITGERLEGNDLSNNKDYYKVTVRAFRTNIPVDLSNENTYKEQTVEFYIDHTDPPEPAIVMNDRSGNIIQSNSTINNAPVSILITDYNMYKDKYWFEIYSNNRCIYNNKENSHTNIPKISIPGNYSILVVMVDRETGRRNHNSYSFTINNSPVTFSDTLKLKPLLCAYTYDEQSNTYNYKYYNDNLPYDGELLIMCNIEGGTKWVPNGEIGIYRDGLVLNKLIDLGSSVQSLEDSLLNAADGNSVELDILMNRTIADSLGSIKKELYYSLQRMMIESAAISETVNNMYDFATTAEIPELDESVMKRIANNAAFIKSRENSSELSNLNNKKYSKIISKFINEQKTGLIDGLQENSRLIGELSYLLNVYRAETKKD